MKIILITGGTGYIGSHTVLEILLANDNYKIVVIDNLCNSSDESIKRVADLTNKHDSIMFYNIDICDTHSLDALFSKYTFDCVIHFAALKSVAESVANPLAYYDNNVSGTIKLLQTMMKHNCKNFIFSSSATVYGTADIPYTEDSTIGTGIPSPYGKAKYMVEEILSDLHKTNTGWKISILRYFNPIGAHSSGLIGEDSKGIPNNLMPYLSQVCVGTRNYLNIFGNDYETPDGTCRRDYIHVTDLALGHLAALNELMCNNGTEFYDAYNVYNLGSGKPTSVLELLKTMEDVVGRDIPYKFADRRPGDLPEFWASVDKAKNKLNWEVTKSIQDMCKDTWNWQYNNPNGYSTS